MTKRSLRTLANRIAADLLMGDLDAVDMLTQIQRHGEADEETAEAVRKHIQTIINRLDMLAGKWPSGYGR